MARTRAEIYLELVAEKNSHTELSALQPAVDDEQTLLSDLTTPSLVAEWRLTLFLVSLAIWMHESLWDIFKTEIEDIAANAIYGTPRWFKDQCLKFQLGDTLEWLGNKFTYADTTSSAALAKQIVQRAAVVETGGQVRIKVAKVVSGVVTALTTAELSAFDAYIQQIRAAGVNTATLSNAPDSLKLVLTVYYDPLVLAPDGSLLGDPGTFPAENAINDFIGNLPFNGKLVLTKLIDAIEAAPGVYNPVLTSAEAKYGALPYSTITVDYTPDAGYLSIDPAFPLSTTITYTPNV